MNHKTVLLFTILAFLLVVALIVFAAFSTQSPQTTDSYTIGIDDKLSEDLCLTIYYLDFNILTRAPLSTSDLIHCSETQKIVVTSDALENNIESLKKLNGLSLQPAKEKTYVNARLYYYIESEKDGKILEVVISQLNRNIIVNGVEVEYNPAFYEIVSPFLGTENGSMS